MATNRGVARIAAVSARPRSVLVLAPDPLGPGENAASKRAARLATILGDDGCRVTLAAPDPSTFPDGPYRTLGTGPVHDQRLRVAFAEHDVSVVQPLAPRILLAAVRHARHLVVDVHAPLAFEALLMPGQDPAQQRAMARWRTQQLGAHLAAADLVLCTNDRQRDLLAGVATLAAEAVPDPRRLAVVPHGIDDEPPPQSSRPLRSAGLVDPDERLVVWGGGLWGWLDPLTAIRAFERLRARRADVKLLLVGTGKREHGTPADLDALAYVRERGLEGGAILIVEGWLDRPAYLDHVLEADVGVSAHGDTLEARYATRTRLLDYLWGGLRVVCTGGDPLGDFVAAEGLGTAVAPGDVDGFAAALEAELDAPRADSGRALEPLRWRNAAQPLVDYCRDPDALPPRDRRRATAAAVRGYPLFLRMIGRGGGAAALARAGARRLGLGRGRDAGG